MNKKPFPDTSGKLDNTLSDVSEKERICCVDNAPDEQFVNLHNKSDLLLHSKIAA